MKPEEQFAEAQAVTLSEMLEAREQRAKTQKMLLKKHGGTLVAFTLNVPGQYKSFPLARKTFGEGIKCIQGQIPDFLVIEKLLVDKNTGDEAYFILDAPAEAVKKRTVAIEEGHPLGRLFDMDVYGCDGVALRGEDTGRSVRTCIVCGGPVWTCSRSRAHSVDELALCVVTMMRDYFAGKFANWAAEISTKALLYEVSATPKPGLVDRADSGAHSDMDIFTFIDSAQALTPYFRAVTSLAMNYEGEACALLALLRYPGRQAESIMLAATKGVNTHKGSIFTFGLLCAAMGLIYARGLENNIDVILDLCAQMAGMVPDELRHVKGAPQTHGERAFTGFGLKGIRGEAAKGYPNVRAHGFPALKAAVESGCNLNDAGVIALLHLIAHVEDTNVVARSDANRLNEIRSAAIAFLQTKPSNGEMINHCAALNTAFVAEGISPGGSADLLAVSYFLYFYMSGVNTEG